MSLVKDILEEIWNTEINYKGMRVNILGIPRFKQYSKKSVRATIDRLKRKGVIEKELSGIVLSKYGKEYVKRKIESLKQFNKPENISKDKKEELDIPTCSAGYLIDQCGLKGKKIGGAQISEKHANFIVNTGSAKAEDVLNLIDICKEKIKSKFNINLKEEIKFVGF